MRLVMDTQVRLTRFTTTLKKDTFVETLNSDNYVVINDNLIFIWNYPGILDNERVFNSFCIIDNIIILLDSESQMYEAYRDGIKYDHIMFKDIARWIKIKYDDDGRRLLRRMNKFRKELLGHDLKAIYYRGIFSDKFSVFLKERELLVTSWNDRDDTKLLGMEENFSFFLKTCKLIL